MQLICYRFPRYECEAMIVSNMSCKYLHLRAELVKLRQQNRVLEMKVESSTRLGLQPPEECATDNTLQMTAGALAATPPAGQHKA